MPAVPKPKPPLARTPTFRTSGHATEVLLANGQVAAPASVPEITRWTSLALHVALERYPFEWAEDRAPRVAAARALATSLAGAAKWTFAHSASTSRWEGAARKPSRFSQRELDAFLKKTVLQRFNANTPSPRLLLRTGGAHDVQYEWSLEITDLGLELLAHDTPKNRAALEKLFAGVRRAHQAAPWATLGHGYAGAASTLIAGVRYPWGPHSAFRQHAEKQLAPPWRGHIGPLWLAVPAVYAKAAALARAKPAIATLDEDGLLVASKPPRAATDRPAALSASAKAFTASRNAMGKMVNSALHARKLRPAILAASWPPPAPRT